MKAVLHHALPLPQTVLVYGELDYSNVADIGEKLRQNALLSILPQLYYLSTAKATLFQLHSQLPLWRYPNAQLSLELR